MIDLVTSNWTSLKKQLDVNGYSQVNEEKIDCLTNRNPPPKSEVSLTEKSNSLCQPLKKLTVFQNFLSLMCDSFSRLSRGISSMIFCGR